MRFLYQLLIMSVSMYTAGICYGGGAGGGAMCVYVVGGDRVELVPLRDKGVGASTLDPHGAAPPTLHGGLRGGRGRQRGSGARQQQMRRVEGHQ